MYSFFEMRKILTKQQKIELLNELRLEKSRKYADRIRVILLLDQGKTYKNIASYLFLDEGTIANYNKRYREGGLEGLINDDYSVKRYLLDPDQLMALSLHLEANIFLSTKEIINFIQQKFNVEYTVSGITKLLHRMSFSYKKPKAVPGKADKKKQQNFIDFYNSLKGSGKIYFTDSTHPQHNPVVSYGWFKKGIEFDIFTNSGRSRLNINGAISLDNMDVITRTCDTVNSDSICDLLKVIKVKNENVKNLYLIMDNASYNRSKKVKNLANKLEIKLIYLPPYSPNLNPIERLWKFFKKKMLYNEYYEKFDDFSSACSKFFQYIRKYRSELESLITDNFRVMGT